MNNRHTLRPLEGLVYSGVFFGFLVIFLFLDVKRKRRETRIYLYNTYVYVNKYHDGVITHERKHVFGFIGGEKSKYG